MRNILMIIVMIVCSSCDINNQKLLLVNKTSNTIYYRLLTDTVINKELQLYKASAYDTVRPNFVMGGKGAWEYAINKRSSDSTLHIFIFTTDKITDDVINNQEFKRLDYKVKDLEALKWIIVFE
ncbi:MAG: hypothetical protein AB7S69_04525 [Salinivirgaceae bacterium]|jgi:phage gp46-like protein